MLDIVLSLVTQNSGRIRQAGRVSCGRRDEDGELSISASNPTLSRIVDLCLLTMIDFRARSQRISQGTSLETADLVTYLVSGIVIYGA
jgi:hypothetical protein